MLIFKRVRNAYLCPEQASDCVISLPPDRLEIEHTKVIFVSRAYSQRGRTPHQSRSIGRLCTIDIAS